METDSKVVKGGGIEDGRRRDLRAAGVEVNQRSKNQRWSEGEDVGVLGWGIWANPYNNVDMTVVGVN